MNDTTPELLENRAAIRTKLKSMGVTHERLADACGVSKSAISFWFSGEISSPALDKAIPAFTAGVEIGLSLAAPKTKTA